MTFTVLDLRVWCAVQAIGFAPIAGVPPVIHICIDRIAAGGTPNPPRCRGGKFNKLAPQVPEGLDAPRLSARRQRRSCRGPPTLKRMARHGWPCPARPKSTISSEPQKQNEDPYV